jgi:hypothetical protein
MPAERRKKRHQSVEAHIFEGVYRMAAMANNPVSCPEELVNAGLSAGNKFLKIF